MFACRHFTIFSFLWRYKRYFFVGECRSPFDYWSFQRFCCCFSFTSHVHLERLVSFYIVYYRRISYICDVSWSLLLLFLNICYLGLLMLKQCICKLCPEIDIDCLWGMLIWFCSCMALYLALFFINFLLCELMMLEAFSVQELLTFTVFL